MSAVEAPATLELSSGLSAGVFHLPPEPRSFGIICLIGGSQTRVGPQRQNVLLARWWSASGFPVLRFDYGGRGDSGGELMPYDRVFSDLRGGIDALLDKAPTIDGVVLWTVCSGYRTAVSYAPRDERVKGIMAGNPPAQNRHKLQVAIRQLLDAKGLTLTRPIHRTASRLGGLLLSGWLYSFLATKSGTRSERFLRSINAFTGNTLILLSRDDADALSSAGRKLLSISRKSHTEVAGATHRHFLDLLNAFSGDSLFLLSDNDTGTKSFLEKMLGRSVLDRPVRVQRRTYHPIKGGGHTFSRRTCLDQVASVTTQWLLELDQNHRDRTAGTQAGP